MGQNSYKPATVTLGEGLGVKISGSWSEQFGIFWLDNPNNKDKFKKGEKVLLNCEGRDSWKEVYEIALDGQENAIELIYDTPPIT